MAWSKIAGSMFLLLITVKILLMITAAQQTVENQCGQTYSPNGASFSIRLPGTLLPTQNNIFNEEDIRVAHLAIDHGLRSRIFNFEVETNIGKRFLVSILEVQTAEGRPHRFITGSEVETINSVIADGIVSSDVIRTATENGEISRWSYKIQAGLGDDDEDDGVVYVRRWNTYMVIVAVSFIENVSSSDAEIRAMLDSLRLR